MQQVKVVSGVKHLFEQICSFMKFMFSFWHFYCVGDRVSKRKGVDSKWLVYQNCHSLKQLKQNNPALPYQAVWYYIFLIIIGAFFALSS